MNLYYGLLHPSISATQQQALKNIESIWFKLATIELSLRDVVSIDEVRVACQNTASHHVRPNHVTIALIDGGDISLINEFFDELLKLPGMEEKQESIQKVKDAWIEYFQPSYLAFSANETVEKIQQLQAVNEIAQLSQDLGMYE